MSDAVILIGAVIGVVLFIVYHKIFRVIYFGKLGPHIFGEILTCWFLGCVIASGLVKLGGSLLEIILGFAVYAFMILMSLYCICLLIYKRKKKFADNQDANNESQTDEINTSKGFELMERTIKWRKENKGISFLIFFFYICLMIMLISIPLGL